MCHFCYDYDLEQGGHQKQDILIPLGTATARFCSVLCIDSNYSGSVSEVERFAPVVPARRQSASCLERKLGSTAVCQEWCRIKSAAVLEPERDKAAVDGIKLLYLPRWHLVLLFFPGDSSEKELEMDLERVC